MKLTRINNGNMNDVFILEINEKKYIVRSSEFDNSFECKILKLLEKYNINSPRLITNFTLDTKNIMIYKYMEGQNPIIFDTTFFENLALILGKLHSIPHEYQQLEYKNNEETLDQLREYYNISIHSKYLEQEHELLCRIYKEIENIDLNCLPKNIIHSDIKKENLITNENEIYLIDFGNVYIGNRLIDLVRVIMWFFIKQDNYDFDEIEKFISTYFQNSSNLLEIEKTNLILLIKYCIFYNLLKDISLYEQKILSSSYIENNSLIWLRSLKDEKRLIKIKEAFKDA